jgi:hypothetical protein
LSAQRVESVLFLRSIQARLIVQKTWQSGTVPAQELPFHRKALTYI